MLDAQKFITLLSKEVEQQILEKADKEKAEGVKWDIALDDAIFDFMYEMEDKISQNIMFLFQYILKEKFSEKISQDNPFIKELGE